MIIVPTLQRRNVVRDAPRHTFMTRRALKIGRRASRTAFLRWSVRNDNLNCRATLCVACRSGRSASSLA
ncbi:hypothetical protein CVE27_13040, partial [Pseudomonas syringae pv. actinidiae]|nr:hypothetical protein [Pseudomonas syringae pv. actinidiae]